MRRHGWSKSVAALAVAVTLGGACGGGFTTPLAPTAPGPRSGDWQGTLVDDRGVSATLRITLDERRIDASRSLVSGTWSATYPDAARDGAGSASGTITGASASLLLSPATPAPCGGAFPFASGSYSAPQLAVSAASIDGAYSQAVCGGTVTGRLSLTRR